MEPLVGELWPRSTCLENKITELVVKLKLLNTDLQDSVGQRTVGRPENPITY